MSKGPIIDHSIVVYYAEAQNVLGGSTEPGVGVGAGGVEAAAVLPVICRCMGNLVGAISLIAGGGIISRRLGIVHGAG